MAVVRLGNSLLTVLFLGATTFQPVLSSGDTIACFACPPKQSQPGSTRDSPPLAHIAVVSFCGHQGERTAIRENWGRDAKAAGLGLTFFVLRGHEECPSEVRREADIHFDIHGLGLADSALDSCKALAYGPDFLTQEGLLNNTGPLFTSIAGAMTPNVIINLYAWLLGRPSVLRGAAWIIKSSDDVFVHVDALVPRLRLLSAMAAGQHAASPRFTPHNRGGAPLPGMLYGTFIETRSGLPFSTLERTAIPDGDASPTASRFLTMCPAAESVESDAIRGQLPCNSVTAGGMHALRPTDLGGGKRPLEEARTGGSSPSAAFYALTRGAAEWIVASKHWLRPDGFVSDAAALTFWVASQDMLFVHDAHAVLLNAQDTADVAAAAAAAAATAAADGGRAGVDAAAGGLRTPIAVRAGAHSARRSGRAHGVLSLEFPLHLNTAPRSSSAVASSKESSGNAAAPADVAPQSSAQRGGALEIAGGHDDALAVAAALLSDAHSPQSNTAARTLLRALWSQPPSSVRSRIRGLERKGSTKGVRPTTTTTAADTLGDLAPAVAAPPLPPLSPWTASRGQQLLATTFLDRYEHDGAATQHTRTRKHWYSGSWPGGSSAATAASSSDTGGDSSSSGSSGVDNGSSSDVTSFEDALAGRVEARSDAVVAELRAFAAALQSNGSLVGACCSSST